MTKPLNVVIQEAKNMIVNGIDHTVKATGIPPYLLELILSSVLADMREQKNVELMSDCNKMITSLQAEIEKLKPKEEATAEDTEEKEGAE